MVPPFKAYNTSKYKSLVIPCRHAVDMHDIDHFDLPKGQKHLITKHPVFANIRKSSISF